jgi:methionine biosynthesis protein MetW
VSQKAQNELNMEQSQTAKTLTRNIRFGFRQLWQDIQFAFANISQMPRATLTRMNYEEYWRARGYHGFQPRYRIIAELIKPGSSVLDIGCGDGWLLEHLTQTRNVKGFGIDVSPEAVRMARERGVTAEVEDVLTWQPSKEYDYVVLSEVLEHLPNSEVVINKVQHCFRQAIIASIPNIGYYPHRLRLLFGRFPVQWSFHPAEHLRFWTVIDFSKWICSFDLEVDAIHSSNGFLVLHKYWPNLLGNQIVFVIRRPTFSVRSDKFSHD